MLGYVPLRRYCVMAKKAEEEKKAAAARKEPNKETKKNTRRRSRNEPKPIVPSAKGKPFVKGTHVQFTFHRHNYKGVVEKQLKNSAIIDFDSEFSHTVTAEEMKQKIVISYAKMKKLKD